MKTIGIIGQGFVGSAVFEGMLHAFDIVSYDLNPNIGIRGTLRSCTNIPLEQGYQRVLDETDGPIFICLPTPMNKDGSCHTGIVCNAVEMLDDLSKEKRVVVIKSTVPPGTTMSLDANCANHICFNPEFLRETSAFEDFKNQDRIIIGGPREGTNILKAMYEKAYPDVPVTKTSSTIAELVKYTTNCFLATKVSFANEMAQVCEALGEDYDKVVEYATKDERLGMSHWAVPGPDGKQGFGGSCFPKDLNAFIKLAESLNVKTHVLEGAWATNLHVRPDKDWEQLKGRAVIESEAS